jgi:putative copper export protein
VWAELLQAVLLLVHVGATAVWLGAMVYSLLVVQPRLARFFADTDEREDFTTLLAAGARWRVLGLAGALALSGAGLTAIEVREADSPSNAWTALVVTKSVLLATAIALFVYVSWRLWPTRLLAHMSGSSDLPRIQSRFRAVAVALTALIAGGLVAGVLADVVR